MNGKKWTDNRKFCVRLLRDLGYGKTSMENGIKVSHRKEDEFRSRLVGIHVCIKGTASLCACTHPCACTLELRQSVFCSLVLNNITFISFIRSWRWGKNPAVTVWHRSLPLTLGVKAWMYKWLNYRHMNLNCKTQRENKNSERTEVEWNLKEVGIPNFVI